MKPEPQKTEKDFGRDLKTFGQLPDKTKELVTLKDQLEKATGPESVALIKRLGPNPNKESHACLVRSCDTAEPAK